MNDKDHWDERKQLPVQIPHAPETYHCSTDLTT